jgi:hypothetical protein
LAKKPFLIFLQQDIAEVGRQIQHLQDLAGATYDTQKEGFAVLKQHGFWSGFSLGRKNPYLAVGYAAEKNASAIIEKIAKIIRLSGLYTPRLAQEIFFNSYFDVLPDWTTEVTSNHTDQIFTLIKKDLNNRLQEFRFFYPVKLVGCDERISFQLGPVTFHSRAAVRETLLEYAKTFRKSKNDPKSRVFPSRLVRYYREFSWCIEITVQAMDCKKADEMARGVLEVAIVSFSLLCGKNFFAVLCRTSDNARDAADTPSHLLFWASKSHEPLTMHQTGWSVEAQFNEPIASDLEAQVDTKLHKGLALVLESAVQPNAHFPLALRMTNTLSMLKAAAKPQSVAVRLLKLVVALECLVNFGEKTGIAKNFALRIASLLSWAYKENKQDNFAIAKRLYALRSKVAHGNIRLGSIEMSENCALAISLATKTISAFFNTLESEEFRETNVSSADLKQYFAALDRDTGFLPAELLKSDM